MSEEIWLTDSSDANRVEMIPPWVAVFLFSLYHSLSGSLPLEGLKGKFMRHMHPEAVSYNLRQGFSELGFRTFDVCILPQSPNPKTQATLCGKLASLPSHLPFSFPRSWSVIVSPWVMLSGWLCYIARGDVQCKAIISSISMHAEFSQPTQSMKVLGCMTQLWVGKTIGKRRQTKSMRL